MWQGALQMACSMSQFAIGHKYMIMLRVVSLWVPLDPLKATLAVGVVAVPCLPDNKLHSLADAYSMWRQPADDGCADASVDGAAAAAAGVRSCD